MVPSPSTVCLFRTKAVCLFTRRSFCRWPQSLPITVIRGAVRSFTTHDRHLFLQTIEIFIFVFIFFMKTHSIFYRCDRYYRVRQHKRRPTVGQGFQNRITPVFLQKITGRITCLSYSFRSRKNDFESHPIVNSTRTVQHCRYCWCFSFHVFKVKWDDNPRRKLKLMKILNLETAD